MTESISVVQYQVTKILRSYLRKLGFLKDFKIDSVVDAQNSPSPFTTYSLFYNGKFVTHEILSESKFKKIIKEIL